MGPLHFEDLEPRRFEDLVRALLIQFKDWYKVEPTGRGGNDDGFDIRAWDRNLVSSILEEEKGFEDVAQNIKLEAEGNLWKIQCKREKSIGPSKLKKYLKENLEEESDIYGYIFAAPVDFSKKSMDSFREEMRSYGVKEFFLWDKATLEDMLHIPANDHILFTFFGISLGQKKRNKVSSTKYGILVKNRLLSMLKLNDTENYSAINSEVVLIDINNNNYPIISKKRLPRLAGGNWSVNIIDKIHFKGLVVCKLKTLGYVDRKKKTYDYITSIDDRSLFKAEQRLYRRERVESESLARDYWRRIPYEYRTRLYFKIVIPYNEILIIDKQGDYVLPIPHIYLDSRTSQESLSKTYIIDEDHNDLEGFKREKHFPKKFPKVKFGKQYNNSDIKFFEKVYLRNDQDYQNQKIFAYAKSGDFKLEINDVINTEASSGTSNYNQKYQIINVIQEGSIEVIKENYLKASILEKTGIKKQPLMIYELINIY